MHHITEVIPREEFLLLIRFDDGELRIFDLKPYLMGSLFTPLKDEPMFRQVRVSPEIRGLAWPNGADLCADMLYMNSQPFEPAHNRESDFLNREAAF